MNIEEYRNRIEKMHTVTGVPSYWEELQKTQEELDEAWSDAEMWKSIAKMFYDRHENRRSCSLLASCKECDAYERAIAYEQEIGKEK